MVMPAPAQVLHARGAMLPEHLMLPFSRLHLPPSLLVILLIVSPAGGSHSKTLMNLLRLVFSTKSSQLLSPTHLNVTVFWNLARPWVVAARGGGVSAGVARARPSAAIHQQSAARPTSESAG